MRILRINRHDLSGYRQAHGAAPSADVLLRLCARFFLHAGYEFKSKLQFVFQA
jgi:hypothetical protein